MIENLQDSLRLVRHLMKFSVEEFVEAIGTTPEVIAALIDTYFARNSENFSTLKKFLDGDGKNYGSEYRTVFRDNSLLKRWFEGLLNREAVETLVREYKIFLDAETLSEGKPELFVDVLMADLKAAKKEVIVPSRSIDELEATRSEEEFYRAKKFIEQMKKEKILKVLGEETDPDFQDTILKVFKQLRAKQNLCLITPNAELARSVLRMNDSAGEGDSKITAGFFTDEGEFKFYDSAQFEDDSEFTDCGYEFKSDFVDFGDEFRGWSYI